VTAHSGKKITAGENRCYERAAKNDASSTAYNAMPSGSGAPGSAARRRITRRSNMIERVAVAHHATISAMSAMWTTINRLYCVAVRLAELLGALSLATDVGLAQPLERALRSAIIAVRLGKLRNLDDEALRESYYVTLLRLIGCTSDGPILSTAMGDDIEPHKWLTPIDMARPQELIGAIFANLNPDRSLLERMRGLLHVARTMSAHEGQAAHCEVAVRLSTRLQVPEHIRAALNQTFERWDGKGGPNKLKGPAIKESVRIAALVDDAESIRNILGPEAGDAVMRTRRGTYHEPALIDLYFEKQSELLAGLDGPHVWDIAMDAEPAPALRIVDDKLDEALRAVADFVDLKSNYTRRHSTGVAELAEEAAKKMGLSDDDIVLTRRAALLHDFGKCAVSTGIWDKKGALTSPEREKVRLHAYYTERLLERPSLFAKIGAVASAIHERADGSGYTKKLSGHQIAVVARVVAAADVYHALVEDRPHRPAFSPDDAAKELEKECASGHLDSDAVTAVLAAAGHRRRVKRKRTWPAGLSDREVDVLRCIVRGQTDKEIASTLNIAKKTVGHHVQHIYDKVGCSTRAGAVMFALEHDLAKDPLE
jgi:putative nucleotidyltransferase with HDIG domain